MRKIYDTYTILRRFDVYEGENTYEYSMHCCDLLIKRVLMIYVFKTL